MSGRIWWKTVKQITAGKVYSGITTLIENELPIINSIEKANILQAIASSLTVVMTTHFHPLGTKPTSC